MQIDERLCLFERSKGRLILFIAYSTVASAKENNRVSKPLFVGFRNVTGYTLSLGGLGVLTTRLRIEVGYDNSWARCCYCMCLGGESMEPKSATNKQKALAYIDAGNGMQ